MASAGLYYHRVTVNVEITIGVVSFGTHETRGRRIRVGLNPLALIVL